MASMSGGIQYSCMRQPPLIKQLKSILSEYPDGGQILKELIQNAEDAEASEVKILYDDRRINHTWDDTTQQFTKFFKGPALCVYNNAVFTDDDWEGIQMIYSSKKENDPLKVGRFGLGFKSVFHITDYPSIISGSKLLMIDPSQQQGMENATVSLTQLDQSLGKGDVQAFWNAFEGLFDFKSEFSKIGNFQGTIFRFPLREKQTELSGTLYNREKVLNLFDGFRSEATSILLFLKNLERITICSLDSEQKYNQLIDVRILDDHGSIKQNRNELKQKIKDRCLDHSGQDISTATHVSIETVQGEHCSVSHWLVVNYFVGDSASEEFRSLIQDKRVGYSPFVGIAAPMLPQTSVFQGHIFCFLPLPKDGHNSTGLPVHVNGYFALSQNRHHLKWETDEQKGKKLDDRSILWNKRLIQEALPYAYKALVQSVVRYSSQEGDCSDLIQVVYNILPKTENLGEHSIWCITGNKLYQLLQSEHFLFCKDYRKWVSIDESCFATFTDLPADIRSVSSAVVKCLHCIGKNHVDIPVEIFKVLKMQFPQVEDLTPKLLSQFLLLDNSYKRLEPCEKRQILVYLFSNEDYDQALHLELLELESGCWIDFNKNGETVYACSTDQMKLLPGLENRLLSSELQKIFPLRIEQLCIKENNQIRRITNDDMLNLLKVVMKEHFGAKSGRFIDQSSSLSYTWLKDLWRYILHEGIVQMFENLPIVPVLKEGSWDDPLRIELKTFQENLLIPSYNGKFISDEVSRCLKAMSAVVIETLPGFIPIESVKQYLILPASRCIAAFFSKIGASNHCTEAVKSINNECTEHERQELASFLSKASKFLSDDAINFLKNISMFRKVQSKEDRGTFGSVYETPAYVIETDRFPDKVPYPFICLAVPQSQENLMNCLGGERITLETLVLELLKNYEEVFGCSVFIDFVLDNVFTFQNIEPIMKSLGNIKFLSVDAGTIRYRASELFDVTDKDLELLLYCESLLPVADYGPARIEILRNLGLRTQKDIDAGVMLKVARTLDGVSLEQYKDKKYQQQSKLFMEILVKRPELLDENIDGYSLGYYLNSLSCIPIQSCRHPSFPNCLEWFEQSRPMCKPCEAREESMCLLVGSKMPVIKCLSEQLNVYFGWKGFPNIETVIDQLTAARERYSLLNRPDLMHAIKTIYEHMNVRQTELTQRTELFSELELVLTEHGFMKANSVYIDQRADILDLQPYFFRLPREFEHIQDMFVSIGCRSQQNYHVLMDTLRKIKANYDQDHYKHNDVQRDTRLVCNILQKLAQDISNGTSVPEDDILMMVHAEQPNKIKLLPASECTYDDDPSSLFEDNGQTHFVHDMISHSIAEVLGVKSVTRKAALDAEQLGADEWGQKEHLTTRIHTLLRDGYADGLPVPKELLQNADDAKASTIKFLYDEREHQEYRERVLSKQMKEFQGPAMWVYNNSTFSERDLENITKLNAGTKESDIQKIGKFGLGFCSVYNLTDLPSFVTGGNIVFFDPHETHLGSVKGKGGTGLKYKLPNKTLMSRFKDQFKPYHGIFHCNILNTDFDGYNGTLFRLPLRTEQQARKSKIYTKSYSREEVISLFEMLVRSAANLLLFSQNVKEIEVYHLPQNASNDVPPSPVLIYCVRKETLRYTDGLWCPYSECVLSRVPVLLEPNVVFQEIHKTTIFQSINPSGTLISAPDEQLSSTSVWLISWAKGQGMSLEMHRSLSSVGSVPIAAVACFFKDGSAPEDIQNAPVGFYRTGHLFCFLPLPIASNLQVHLNGFFNVTSNRQQLVTLNEDGKSSTGNLWNKYLMEDANVIAFVNLLETLSCQQIDDTYNYHHLWPTQCSESAIPFKIGFYRHIIRSNSKVFKGTRDWVAFKSVIFLDPEFYEREVGKLAFEYLSHLQFIGEKSLVEMSACILKEIREWNCDQKELINQAIFTETAFFKHFIMNINDSFWNRRQEDRNKLVLCALQCAETDVLDVIRETDCIPTDPAQTLRKPRELVHHLSNISSLFDTDDGRFVANTKAFRDESILSKLVDLGMLKNDLPPDLFVERCKSIRTLASKCCGCARERCAYVLEYMSKESELSKLENENETLNLLQELYMFPIMAKPCSWKFSWYGEETSSDMITEVCSHLCERHKDCSKRVAFGKSTNLSRKTVADYVGSVHYIIEEEVFEKVLYRRHNISRLLKMLKIDAYPTDIPIARLVHQTSRIVDQYVSKNEQFSELRRIHDSLFTFFNSCVSKTDYQSEAMLCLRELSNRSVFLVDDNLVDRNRVAFHLKEIVKPFFYQIPEVEKRTKHGIYQYLGVREYFEVGDIVRAMQDMTENWHDSHEDIAKMGAVLRNLGDIFDITGTHYEAFQNYHNGIYAPDKDGKLYRTYELSNENTDFDFDVDIKMLHPSIAPSTGTKVGVKSKELRCFEDISMGISFGQHEKLVTRIQGLLKAYPSDEAIMKELLQNADDAGATEIHFVKDYRMHSTNRIFSKNCQPLQGPAILVYNDSYFRKEDLEGLHNLGQGSKSSDPTKTGQYGVGFNAVYHLTDTPSFITIGPGEDNNRLMIVLDPLCKHVPKATLSAPGQMCKLKDVRRNFPDQLLAFSPEELIKGEVGTVFRFPLRQMTSDISKTIFKPEDVDALLMSFRNIMFESVLFLKSVSKIRISDITSGVLVEQYSVTVRLSEKAAVDRNIFHKNIKKVTKEHKTEKVKNLEIEPFSVRYPLTVVDNVGNSQEWIIAQKFGFSDIGTDQLRERIKDGDIGLLPIGGIAMPIELKKIIPKLSEKSHSFLTKPYPDVAKDSTILYSFSGKAFCFLPLPIDTGLPVHINGHFALDHESRRELWKDGYRLIWNTCIVDGIVISCWISALELFQQMLTSKVTEAPDWKTINEIMALYHKYFPVSYNAESTFWKHVVTEFYVKSLKKSVRLFPCVLDRKSEITPDLSLFAGRNERSRFCVQWTPVTTNADGIFQGVFNTIYQYQTSSVTLIASLLKAFGIKLLETPNHILGEFTEAGIVHVAQSTPDTVISFIKTWNSEDQMKCVYGQIDVNIENTKFKSEKNLSYFLGYLTRDENFAAKIEGLPILLTGDGILKVFSREYPVFNTRYSELLPKSANQFVHKTVQSVLKIDALYMYGLLKRFQFKDFVELLPQSLDRNNYASKIPFREEYYGFLTMFFEFLCEMSKPDGNHEKEIVISVKNNIRMIGNWSFLPCVENSSQHFLVPLKECSHILHLTNDRKLEKVGLTLSKFNLPTLDTNLLLKCGKSYLVPEIMTRCVASLEEPYQLLQCVHFYKHVIENESTTESDAISMLAYFDGHLNNLINASEHDVKDLLKTLPLFPTLQNTLTSIVHREKVVVLPVGMPTDGIQSWAEMTNTTLLKNEPSVKNLYSFLGFETSETEKVYAGSLLPKINYMPIDHWIKHIEFLKDCLGHLDEYTPEQSHIVQLLKQLAFINLNGTMKRADELYDPSNNVFACMKSEFPPKNLLTKSWKSFLKKLGLMHTVTDEQLVSFAREIERDGCHKIDQNVQDKSQRIIKCFVGREKWNSRTYKQLSTIHFILPHKLKSPQTTVHPQHDNAEKLICFKSAVSSLHAALCWSCVNLLDHDLICRSLSSTNMDSLGVNEEPPLEKVTLHCQNVVDSFKILLPKGEIAEDFVKKQMAGLYIYLYAKRDQSPLIKSRLQQKPIIHLPTENDMVLISDIVLDLLPKDEIKPYLFRSPKHYGQFDSLFEAIGTKKQVTFRHYADVLQKLKLRCGDNEMFPDEKEIFMKVLNGLLSINVESDTDALDVDTLYFPNEKEVLKQSRQLVYCNRKRFMNRLHTASNTSFDYVVNSARLEKPEEVIEGLFSKLPTKFRPIMLSDIIEETLCLENGSGQDIPYSHKTSEIQTFWHSEEFANALCCILKHQFAKKAKKIKLDDNYYQIEISQNLRNVRFMERTELKTILKYQNSIIPGTEKVQNWYIQTNNGQAASVVFYFQDSRNTERLKIRQILPGLIRLVRVCVPHFKGESDRHLMSVLDALESGERLQHILDELDIMQYGSGFQNDFYPKPGTYVEQHFIPFLEQGIRPFKENEMVALELEDSEENDTEQNQVFIYVKVLREFTNHVDSDLQRKYVIDTGCTDLLSEVVPIYRLFRFVRPVTDPGRELQIYDGEPVGARPFDAHCLRIRQDLIEAWKLSEADRKRIIRRLLLKWHPDRNPENAEYCKQVFQYIKIIISRLESREEIVENVAEEMSRGQSCPASGSTYNRYFNNIDKRAKVIYRAFYDNYEEYSRAERTGRYSHSTAAVRKRPDPGEAERWLRQAKNDFKAASVTYPNVSEVDGFNWVCYMCHQACEKALKSSRYSQDANNVPKGSYSHYLSNLTSDRTLLEQTQLLEARLGDHARLRYPDTQSRPKIPSDVFTKEDAEFSLKVAKRIIEIVEELNTQD